MTIYTYGDLFTGFGGSCLGATAAGLTPVFGIEIDPAIAEVANANLGGHIHVADILNCNPMDFEAVDVLHASPPCTRASTANSSAELNDEGTKEAPLDIALANKIIEFTAAHLPDVVTVENVWAYRRFQSWMGGRKCEGIQNALHRLGYWVSVEHVNAADAGVPQTRKRMIVRAVRGGFVPYLPEPVPWVGWYAAIEDLLDTLPESRFANWQLARLPTLLASTLVSNAKTEYGDGLRCADEPALTVTPEQNGRLRALLESGRVVSMTPRSLARFQSFPDWYELPDKARLAAKGIGNAAPPLLMEKIFRGLMT